MLRDRDSVGRGAEEDNPADDELVDASVKMLRLLANLSIDESIGKYLSSRTEPFQMLQELLLCADQREELVLNVVAACTNLTYYVCVHEDSSKTSSAGEADQLLAAMACQLSQSLFHENEELVLEASRALGNLTRKEAIIRELLARRIDEALALLLNHSNLDIVSSVTGTLINFSGFSSSRESLMNLNERIITPFDHILRKSSLRNLSLSVLVCQVIASPQHSDYRILLTEQVLHNLFGRDSVHTELRTRVIKSCRPLQDTLMELVECADDVLASSDRSDRLDDFAEFSRVGKLVLELLAES